MLILTRRVGDSLYVGDDIVVTVLEVNGFQVRIGIDAPKDVAIVREEIAPEFNGTRKADAYRRQENNGNK